ncbi:MAG: hypothetical protein ACTSQS_13715 [Promethearchaeota archaeon]
MYYIGVYNTEFFPYSILIPAILIIIALLFVWLSYNHFGNTVNKAFKIFIVILSILAGIQTFSISLYTEITLFYLSGAI